MLRHLDHLNNSSCYSVLGQHCIANVFWTSVTWLNSICCHHEYISLELLNISLSMNVIHYPISSKMNAKILNGFTTDKLGFVSLNLGTKKNIDYTVLNYTTPTRYCRMDGSLSLCWRGSNAVIYHDCLALHPYTASSFGFQTSLSELSHLQFSSSTGLPKSILPS